MVVKEKKEFSLPIYNTEGKEIDSVKLDSRVFNGEVNTAAIYQVVIMYRANKRRGLASTKTRGEVSGGGRKPWRQKGTGRARVGSIRSPLWRHGGAIFGPHPRNFSYELPKRIKAAALRSSLNVKLNENNLIVLDQIKIDSPKTKEAIKLLSNLKINDRSLLLLDKITKNLRLATRNISLLTTNIAKDTNVYEVLDAKKVILTLGGLKDLVERLKR